MVGEDKNNRKGKKHRFVTLAILMIHPKEKPLRRYPFVCP